MTDPVDLYKAIMFYGSSPLSNDLLALAKHFNKKTGRQFSDFRLQNSMISQDKNRIVFDGFYTDPQNGKREFRCWLSGHDGDFIYSSVEVPEGKLTGSMQKLLTILTNIRVTKGAFKFKGVPNTKVFWGSYRLRDGSASFLVPKNWRVQELGAGQFIANDPSGAFSFIVASVEVLTPMLGVNVPGTAVSPYLQPHQALQFLTAQQGIATNMRFEEINPRQDIAQQIGQVYTHGSVIVEDFIYTCVTQVRLVFQIY